MKKKIIPITILIVFIGIFVFHYLSSRTVYNEETAVGAYSGNLLNEGVFCEYNNRIYFSNLDDNGAIYSMASDASDVQRVSTDKGHYINVYGNYIYYARRNNTKVSDDGEFFNFNKTGLYRMNLNGSKLTSLYEKASGMLALSGNQLLYQHYNKKNGLRLYKVNIDKKERKELSNEPILPGAIHNGMLYYVGTEADHNIYTMNLLTYENNVLVEGNFSHLIINNNYLYYWDLSNQHAISRMKLDGSQSEVVTSDTEKCSSYNINLSGKYLYYQIDDGENSCLYRKDLDTGEIHTVMKGNFFHIQVTSNYVFFQEYNTDNMYWMQNSKDAKASEFHPGEL